LEPFSKYPTICPKLDPRLQDESALGGLTIRIESSNGTPRHRDVLEATNSDSRLMEQEQRRKRFWRRPAEGMLALDQPELWDLPEIGAE